MYLGYSIFHCCKKKAAATYVATAWVPKQLGWAYFTEAKAALKVALGRITCSSFLTSGM